MGQLNIASLGSSYAAGPGIPPIEDRAASRSSKNYAHILAALLGARLTDLSVSGATMANLIDQPQETWVTRGTRFEPQFDGVPADADLVLITAGGNDLNYIGGMFADSLRAYLFARLFMSAAPQEAAVDAETLAGRFISLIDNIGEKALRARIFLLEYLTVLGPQTKAGVDVSFDEQRIKYHQGVAGVLNDALHRAGKARPNVTVVPIAEKSLHHALGSETPWVDPLTARRLAQGKPCLHPNLDGMQAVADILYTMTKNMEPAS
jgi:hypothetical protein